MKRESHQRFWGLQYLRAIAALMVVCCHFVITFQPALGGPHVYGLLARGVDIFFVISGFVMVVTASHLSPGEFVRRRVARIVPLYWLLTGVVALRAVLAPHVAKNLQVTWPYFVKSLLFIPFANPSAGDAFRPLLVPGWSLNYEMFFYAIFALILWLARDRLLLYTGILFVAMTVAHGFLQPGSVGYFYCDPIILEFWLGMAIGQYYRAVRLSRWMSLALVAGGFALMPLSFEVSVSIIAATAI